MRLTKFFKRMLFKHRADDVTEFVIVVKDKELAHVRVEKKKGASVMSHLLYIDGILIKELIYSMNEDRNANKFLNKIWYR